MDRQGHLRTSPTGVAISAGADRVRTAPQHPTLTTRTHSRRGPGLPTGTGRGKGQGGRARVYAELARAVDDCSDEDLLKPRPGRIGRRVGGGPRQRAPAFRRAPGVSGTKRKARQGGGASAPVDARGPRSGIHRAQAPGLWRLQPGVLLRQAWPCPGGSSLPQAQLRAPAGPEGVARTDKDLDKVRDDPEMRAILE